MPKVRRFQRVAAITAVFATLALAILATSLLAATASAQQLPRLAGTPDPSDNQQDQDKKSG